MLRFVQVAQRPFPVPLVRAALAQVATDQSTPTAVGQDNHPRPTAVPRVERQALMTFVVKLRNATTRMWGNQIEVRAASAADAAEDVAGEHLVEGGGVRADLRASVWATPFGSTPCRMFYVPGIA
jgi:hypothetical protein